MHLNIESSSLTSLMVFTWDLWLRFQAAALKWFLLSTAGRSGKAKPKFLFQSQPQKKDFALVVHESCESSTPLSVLPLNAELDMQRENIESLDDLLENHGGNEVQQFEENSVPSEVAVVHDPNEHSMAEVLDHFQHTSSVSRGNSKMVCFLLLQIPFLKDLRNTTVLPFLPLQLCFECKNHASSTSCKQKDKDHGSYRRETYCCLVTETWATTINLRN